MTIYQSASPNPEVAVLMATKATWEDVAKRLGPHTRISSTVQLAIRSADGETVRIPMPHDMAVVVLGTAK